MTAGEKKNFYNPQSRLTVTEEFIRIISTVVLPIAPGAVPHTAAIHTLPVTLLTHTVD